MTTPRQLIQFDPLQALLLTSRLMSSQRPTLKNGVDLQLQSAFTEGNWAVVIRLAEKRARAFNDQYYEIVKVCAESQLDDPNAKFAAVAAIAQFVKDGTVVKDADGLDLLEWAAGNLLEEDDFHDTLGPLRVRCAKAAPKDKVSSTRCLESCLLHWDLVSAQQIAAILDRSFPQERSFMFWNIVITHMLSISTQAADVKKKLYGTLALKQIQRAAQTAEQADESKTDEASKVQTRHVQTEEEIILLYEIVETHGTKEDFEKLIASPIFSPVAQFRQGSKELLFRAIAKYRQESDHQSIYKLCKDCLSLTDESGQPSLLASDWAIWKQFITAATNIKTSDPEAEKTVHELLLKFVKVPNLRPIYRRNILLARVFEAFTLATNDEEDVTEKKPTSTRLQELISYIGDQATSAACFDDIKALVGDLSAAGKQYLAYEYAPRLAEETEGKVDAARVQTLSLKLKYFVSTCALTSTTTQGDKPQKKCTLCQGEVLASLCGSCFSALASEGLKFYTSLDGVGSAAETEIKPEVAMVVALCYVQQAFLSSSQDNSQPTSSIEHILRALLLLEHQISLTPKHSVVSLLLVQLHLLIGSAHQAREHWMVLGVKRTIMDSLAPIFYDRLSTIDPAIISPGNHGGWSIMQMLESHFTASLKLRMPRRLIDAFEACNYGSVIDIPNYMEDLRWSSTRAMSLVEEMRIQRFLGYRLGNYFEDPRFNEITDETELNSVLDFGSFPSWECSSQIPVYTRLQVGPKLSNRRAHLSLLSEAFHEILGYKTPPSYKVSLATSQTDQIYILETFNQLSNSFSKFLHAGETDLTRQEAVYFETISLLATLIPFVTTIDRAAPLPPVFSQIVEAVIAALDTFRHGFPTNGLDEIVGQVSLLSSMHSVSLFRDTSVAIRDAARWIIAFNDREKERDRSGKSNLPKDVVAKIKDLQSAAEAASKEGKDWIIKLKDEVYRRDFQPKVRTWVLAGEDELANIVGSDSLNKLVKSWEETIKGWKGVKWE